MNISETLTYAVDLAGDTLRQVIRQPLIRGDAKAHTVQVVVNDHGIGADLTGCTASMTVVRTDGATVNCTATISGSVITSEMLSAVYVYTGEVQVFVRIVSGGYTRTVLWLTGNVITSTTDTIADSTQTLPSIDQFNSLLSQCQTAATTAQTALTTISSYPYTTVQGYATAAANSATAAAKSAQDASAASGLPATGNEGAILVKTASGSEWDSTTLPALQDDIANAGHTITYGTATATDSATVTTKLSCAERSVTFTLDETADAVIVTGINFDKMYSSNPAGLVIHSIHTAISGTTVTVYYRVTNASAANLAPGSMTIYYIAFS